MSQTWKIAIGIILIFVLGWFGGALTTLGVMHKRIMSFVNNDPEQMAVLLERQTTRNLGLSEDQRKQIHTLLVENLRERIRLNGTVQPQVHAVNAETLRQIDTLLTADQQEKFYDNLLRFKARFGRNPLNSGGGEPSRVAPGGATNATAGTPSAH